MKNFPAAIIGVLLFLGIPSSRAAQTTPSPTTSPQASQPSMSEGSTVPEANRLRIAPGSVIPVELTKGVDSKKVKTGDEVDAKVTQDLRTDQGQIIVPKNTKIVGRVTEAQPHTKEQKEAQVGIVFDRAITSAGDSTLPMSIQAIISPSVLNNPAINSGGGGFPPNETSPGGSSSAGQPPQMGRGPTEQSPTPSTGGNLSSDSQSQMNSRPNITGDTKGVLGFSDLKLTMADNVAQGAVISSDKSNVKLESGTFMLLRVNP
jgi:hypothetical protein